MNIMVLGMAGDWLGNLSLKVVHYCKSCLVTNYSVCMSHFLYIRHNHVLYILQHNVFSWPVVGGVGDVPVWWEGKPWVTVIGLALVISCMGRKSPRRVPQKTAVICLLSFAPTISTPFWPCFSIVQDEHGTNFIPVWSQLRISSAGTVSLPW